MSEPPSRAANGSDPAGPEPLGGEVVEGGARADVRHLPVPAPEPRTIERRAAALPAPAVAATGGFLAGVATFVLVRVLRRRGSTRALGRSGRRRSGDLEVAGSRSFLVDVHLLKR